MKIREQVKRGELTVDEARRQLQNGGEYVRDSITRWLNGRGKPVKSVPRQPRKKGGKRRAK